MAKAVILAGGQGERFWPLTHKDFPKYRVKFEAKKTLLQGTYQRLLEVYGKKNIYVVTTAGHAKMIREELPKLDRAHIFIEPFRNNTCAAIYFSCANLQKTFGQEEVMSFFPADHLIKNKNFFKKTMREAVRLAQDKELLVTLGIPPTFPATGYGYIQKGGTLPGFLNAYRVNRFIEKPGQKKAEHYFQEKKYVWNAGIFTWRTGVFMRAMRRHSPGFERALNLANLEASYKKLPNISIDVALMEKADNVAVIQTRMDWCDMGSWDMLFEKSLRDKKNNYAQGFYYHKEVRDSLIVNHSSQPVVLLGVSDLLVVQTSRGTLICRKGRAEEAALLSRKL